MPTSIRVLVLALALSLPFAARAADPKAAGPKLVAILPLDGSGAKLDESSTRALEETIRSVTASILSSAGYTLLTGETTLRILADNGIDAAKACEASCAMDLARELKAQLFISAAVTRADTTLYAFVRLFDSESGRQLSMVKFDGPTVSSLVDAFEGQSPDLFAPLGVKVQARAREMLVVITGGTGTNADLLDEVGESAREGALKAAKPAGVNVLSKDVAAKAAKSAACASGSCSSVELARAAGADLVMTVQVSVLEGQYLTKLRVEQAKTGDLLVSDRMEGRSQLDTVRRIPDAAEKLARQVVGAARPVQNERINMNTAFNQDPNALDRMQSDVDVMRNPTGPVGPQNGQVAKPVGGGGKYAVPTVDRKKVAEVRDGIWDGTSLGLMVVGGGNYVPAVAGGGIGAHVGIVWNALQPDESTCVYGFGLGGGLAAGEFSIGTIAGETTTSAAAAPVFGVPVQMTCGSRFVFTTGLEPAFAVSSDIGGFNLGANIGLGYGTQAGGSGWAIVVNYRGWVGGQLSGGPGADFMWTF